MAETVQVVIQGEDRLSKPVQAGSRALEGLQRSADQVTGKMGLLSAAFHAPGAAIGGMVGALGKIGLAGMGIQALVGAAQQLAAPIMQGVAAASDLNETVNKVTVVFGDAAPAVMAFGETSAKALGMSKNEALGAAATYGNLFTTMGLGTKESAEFSTNLLKNAADLASFNNIDPTIVLDKLRAGLVGESEPARQLGMDISDTAMGIEALRQGITKATKDMTQAEKVQLRYALIQQQMKNATNDFANTSDGLANSQRIVAAQMKDASAALGGAFMPAVVAITSAISKVIPPLVEVLTPAIAEFGKIATSVAERVAALFAKLPNVFKMVAGAFGVVRDQFGKLVKMVEAGDIAGAMSEAFRGLVGLVRPVIGRITDLFRNIDWAGLFGKVTTIGAGIVKGLGNIAGAVTGWLRHQWASVNWGSVWRSITNLGAGLVNSLGSIGSAVTQWLKDQWARIDWPGIWGTITDMGGKLVKAAGDIFNDVTTWLIEQWKSIKWDQVWAAVTDIGAKMIEGLVSIPGSVTQWIALQWASIQWDQVWATVVDMGSKMFSGLVSIVGSVTSWLGVQWAGIQWDRVWAAVSDMGKGMGEKITELAPGLQSSLEKTWAGIDWGAIKADNKKADEALAAQISSWDWKASTKATGDKLAELLGLAIAAAMVAPIALPILQWDVGKWLADQSRDSLHASSDALVKRITDWFTDVIVRGIGGAPAQALTRLADWTKPLREGLWAGLTVPREAAGPAGWGANIADELIAGLGRADVIGRAKAWVQRGVIVPIGGTLSEHDWFGKGAAISQEIQDGLDSVKLTITAPVFGDLTALEEQWRSAGDTAAQESSRAARALSDAYGNMSASTADVVQRQSELAAGMYAGRTATSLAGGEAERYREAMTGLDQAGKTLATSITKTNIEQGKAPPAISNTTKAMTALERALASIQLKLGAFNLKDLEDQLARMLKRKRPTGTRAGEAFDRAVLEQQAAILQQRISIEGTSKELGGAPVAVPAGVVAPTAKPTVGAPVSAAVLPGLSTNTTSLSVSGPLVTVQNMVVSSVAEGQAAAKQIAEAVTQGIANLIQNAGRASGAANPAVAGATRAV